MADFCLVLVTCAGRTEAGRIAGALVAKKAAACVNILPGLQSVYRWKGKIERSSEVLLVAKSRLKSFAAISKIIRQLHSYECPEILAVPIQKGHPPYMEWLKTSVSLRGGEAARRPTPHWRRHSSRRLGGAGVAI